MIDKRHQGNEYGKKAIQLLLAYVKAFPYGEAEYMYAEWHPENKSSEKLCITNGFVVIGTEEDGAIKASLKLNS